MEKNRYRFSKNLKPKLEMGFRKIDCVERPYNISFVSERNNGSEGFIGLLIGMVDDEKNPLAKIVFHAGELLMASEKGENPFKDEGANSKTWIVRDDLLISMNASKNEIIFTRPK